MGSPNEGVPYFAGNSCYLPRIASMACMLGGSCVMDCSQFLPKRYDGYGSCPLTVENGKVILAEFGYGGKLLPSFPRWFIDGSKPTRAAWYLKERLLPAIYWHGMLKGREPLAKPKHTTQL